ncbi:cupin domain-containing protein [Candidatus Pacearchaeota archaeon]|nr:MAG: cupin domain-containing protein [Candidatus Pacearchaeota archaeon]
MLIKKEESRKHENSKTCTVWEYDHLSEKLSYATSLINGRYPEEKRVTNLECEEMCYVMSGSGKIHSDKGDFEINEGDSYLFEQGEKYYIEGDNLKLALINSPKWRPEQHKVVD